MTASSFLQSKLEVVGSTRVLTLEVSACCSENPPSQERQRVFMMLTWTEQKTSLGANPVQILQTISIMDLMKIPGVCTSTANASFVPSSLAQVRLLCLKGVVDPRMVDPQVLWAPWVDQWVT